MLMCCCELSQKRKSELSPAGSATADNISGPAAAGGARGAEGYSGLIFAKNSTGRWQMTAQHGGAVQVKALPELWIPFSLPFSPPPSAAEERSTCQDSFLHHKGCIHLDLRKHVGKKRKKPQKNSLIAGVEENKRGFHFFLSRTAAFWSR